MQQEQQMGGGGGGGGEPTRRLARFQSAPATWFDTLLQDDELLTQNQCLSQVLVNSSTIPNIRNPDNYSSAEADPTFFDQGIGAPSFGFLRHNSSPADFLAQLNSASSVGGDGDLSSFGVSSNYDYLALPDVQTNKCARESDPEQAVAQSSANFSSQERGEQSVSLPGGMASISDMEMERLFSDSVPCRVRAKRGCATHPRSIAERVRRTRISDRIRKLQELVPNMDKQTNTADMLEEAVEYVKLLQKQIQELSELQRKCKCIGRD